MIKPLFKTQEPFMEYQNGYGFQGVLMHDDTEDKVQCHICGKWFGHLGKHVRQHDISPDEYRMQVGLSLRTGLCSKRISIIRSRVGKKIYPFIASKLIRGSKKNRTRRNIKRLQINRQKPSSSMQFKNSRGLCDLQIRARYQVVKVIVNHEPTAGDLKTHDSKLYGVICQRYGINPWRKMLGAKQLNRNEYRMVPDIDLIGSLRKKAYQLRRPPRPTDFIGLKPNITTFYRRFGSWCNALRCAGLK